MGRYDIEHYYCDDAKGTELKLGVSNPFCWPEVRRGGERLQYALCQCLVGHHLDVTLLASRPPEITADIPSHVTDGTFEHGRAVLGRPIEFAWKLRSELVARNIERLYALTHFDAAAALSLGARQRPFVTFHTIGAPTLQMFRRRPIERLMLHKALRQADRLAVLSSWAHDRLASDLGRRIEILPAPVDLETFPRKTTSDTDAHSPFRILFSGDANEPRKGAGRLARAFRKFRQTTSRPMEVWFSGAASSECRRDITALAGEDAAVTFFGTGTRAQLPALYRQASVLVLPAANEAFGLVLLEALASGTPVIGATPGGAADIITDPETGALFDLSDGSDKSLLQALHHCHDLARDPATPQRCRTRATAFGWDVLGERYRDMLL